MYLKHHTKGIVISGRAEDIDSKRLNILTESFGLISARVQGSRNQRSKLRGGSQDFSFGEFSLIHGKSGWRVVSARSDKNFFEIFRTSPEKLKMAGNVLNLVRRLMGEDQGGSEGVFKIVLNFFEFLANPLNSSYNKGETKENNNIVLAECLTLLRILHSLGYMKHDPELSIPISHSKIEAEDLSLIAPRRLEIISLINESLKAT